MLWTSHVVRARSIDQEFACLLNLEAKIALLKRKRLRVFLKVVLSIVKFLNGMLGVDVLSLVASV